MQASITNRNRPNVIIVTGIVNMTSKGLSRPLSIARMNATIIAVRKSLI
jgi:hypothetical protein